MALEKITMPQLGESVTEGTINIWLVKPGDSVKKYDPLAEVQTDKVVAEIPSSFAGVIKEQTAKEGETLVVGALICYIETEEIGVDGARQTETVLHNQPNKHRYSPAVLRMSQEHNIDLEQVNGTGKGGRITRKDLQKLIDSGQIPKAGEKQLTLVERQQQQGVQKTIVEQTEHLPHEDKVNQKDTTIATSTSVQIQSESTITGDIEIPVTRVRKTIAANMVRSKHEAPHAWVMIEVDVTNLVAYRDSLKDEFKKKEGFSLTYFAFFVKAVAQALKEYPMMNSMWAGDKIIQKKDINISIAVATYDALYVPVIRNADEKTIKGIAREITVLAQKARTGKLTASEMEGGTFTVNNTGSFGSIQSMGIINYPQAAILQVESVVKRSVVIDGGMFAARDMVNLCMSIDHRVLDGLICGRFLTRVKGILENITKENTSIY